MTPGLGKQLSTETWRHKRIANEGLASACSTAEPPQQSDSVLVFNRNVVIAASSFGYAPALGEML
jgi:hypothetical protein